MSAYKTSVVATLSFLASCVIIAVVGKFGNPVEIVASLVSAGLLSAMLYSYWTSWDRNWLSDTIVGGVCLLAVLGLVQKLHVL